MEENKDIMEENNEPKTVAEPEGLEVCPECPPIGEEPVKEQSEPQISRSEYAYNWRSGESAAPTEKRKHASVAIPVLCVVCAVLAIALMATVGTLAFVLSGRETPANVNGSIADIVDMCYDHTVVIQTRRTNDQGEKEYPIGTGIVLTENGYIATNSHVIKAAENITVTTYEGKTYSGKVIADDPAKDIALVKLSLDEGESLKTARIGDYDDIRVGDRVFAIGTPYSPSFAYTVSVGHVSHRERMMSTYGGGAVTMVQIDVPVNHGNSGGPLINERGEVIGIVTLKLNESYEGINFAIPISEHMNFFNSAIDADMAKPQLGVTGVSVEADAYYYINDRSASRVYLDDTGYYLKETSYSSKYYLSEDESQSVRYAKDSGFMILGITENSDANGKLSIYDIVTEFDGVKLLNDAENDPYDTVVGILGTKKASDEVKVKYLREGIESEVTLALREK